MLSNDKTQGKYSNTHDKSQKKVTKLECIRPTVIHQGESFKLLQFISNIIYISGLVWRSAYTQLRKRTECT